MESTKMLQASALTMKSLPPSKPWVIHRPHTTNIRSPSCLHTSVKYAFSKGKEPMQPPSHHHCVPHRWDAHGRCMGAFMRVPPGIHMASPWGVELKWHIAPINPPKPTHTTPKDACIYRSPYTAFIETFHRWPILLPMGQFSYTTQGGLDKPFTEGVMPMGAPSYFFFCVYTGDY